jgi:protein CpxP
MMHSKNNLLVIGVIALALVNLGLLAFIWIKRPENQPRQGMPPGTGRDVLIKDLSFDPAQARRFDTLRTQHFNLIKNYREETRRLKDAFFGQLKEGKGSPDSLARQIADLQEKIDLATYHHFESVRNLCTDDQKKKFDNVIEDVIRNMGAPGRRPPGDGPPPEGPPEERRDH